MTRQGETIEVETRTGPFEISLPEIPTSGYLWEIAAVPAGVAVLDHEYDDAKGPIVACSATKSCNFTFEMKSAR